MKTKNVLITLFVLFSFLVVSFVPTQNTSAEKGGQVLLYDSGSETVPQIEKIKYDNVRYIEVDGNLVIYDEIEVSILVKTNYAGINFTVKTSTYRIKFLYQGVERARTQLKIEAAWQSWPLKCVQVNYVDKYHWVYPNYGSWTWGGGTGEGFTPCKASILKDRHDYLTSQILGNWHTYISSILNKDQVGNFHWIGVVN